MDEKALVGGGIAAAILALIAAAAGRNRGGRRNWQRLQKLPGAYAASSMPSSQIMQAVTSSRQAQPATPKSRPP